MFILCSTGDVCLTRVFSVFSKSLITSAHTAIVYDKKEGLKFIVFPHGYAAVSGWFVLNTTFFTKLPFMSAYRRAITHVCVVLSSFLILFQWCMSVPPHFDYCSFYNESWNKVSYPTVKCFGYSLSPLHSQINFRSMFWASIK